MNSAGTNKGIPMSGLQPSLTDRIPSIFNKDLTDKRPKNGKSSVSLKHEFDPTGLVQRCVIIQRDENGFGLTVSGDNPVFVQLVKEDGAAMRAGVQTGDRIIKVNGRLVTHSNHIEVVELIKSGSYVALTVLGRPPGLSQILLEEEKEKQNDEKQPHSPSAPNSPGLPGENQISSLSNSTLPNPQNLLTCSPHNEDGVLSGLRNGEDEEGDAPSLKEQTFPFRSEGGLFINNNASPDTDHRDDLDFCSSPDTEDAPDSSSNTKSIVGSPPYTLNLQIIGAEDEYFDSQQEQIDDECSCFQSIDSLKSRPAHLAVFLYYVVSQFDPAPLLCYLYADMHKQMSSKEGRRFFLEFHSLFLDRTAHLKVPAPEAVTAELEKRRLELIPENLCKQFTQKLQESLSSELHKNLEDFRQKRSMGLTLAEDELPKLDSEPGKDQQALEKECSCAEPILSMIEHVLSSPQPSEEEKCQTMQYVILTYMKHLGVKVKEPRWFEHKRLRSNFMPKLKVKTTKPEKEGEGNFKKNLFPKSVFLVPRLSRGDSMHAADQNKPHSPKLPQGSIGIPELPDSSGVSSGLNRANQPKEVSCAISQPVPSTAAPGSSSFNSQASDMSRQETDSNVSPISIHSRLSDNPSSGDPQDGLSSPTSTHFDFSASNLDQREEDQDAFRMDVQSMVSSAEFQSEDDQAGEVEAKEDPLNWQKLVSRGVLASLTPKEIKRQEVINELFYTERAHLRMLKVLDCVFCQRLNRDGILPPEDIKHIFINLEEIIQLHISVTEQMTAIRKRSETSVIGQIGDDLLAWFSGEEEETIKAAVGTFCSNQPSALELIKTRQKKDQKFNLFMQEARSNRMCRRLQLKDIIPVEMQRVTKYPLLLENIAKYTEDGEEKEKVKKAGKCCKNILNHVNQAVKEAENKQRLEEHQRRLDVSSLKQSENPVILELRNLDLTKRKMVHEGPLFWKVNKDKTIELYTILLEDMLVLLQKQDERLVLKFHGKNLTSAPDTKHIFSPVIKLNTVLVRPVATDNKSFFVLSMSENGVQMYELMAQTVSDREMWQFLITQRADAMKAIVHNNNSPPAQSEAEQEAAHILSDEMPKQSVEPSEMLSENASDKDSPLEIQPPINPFDGIKSDDEEKVLSQEDGDEEEVLVVANRLQEEEEVDEAEVEAFLDGQLADRLLQEIVVENNHSKFNTSSSKAEEALQTLLMLKQAIFSHMMSREVEEETDEGKPSGASEDQANQGSSAEFDGIRTSESSEKESEETQQNGGFMVLDCEGGPEEMNGIGADVGIDMRKLLSSSSLVGSSGPNLSRQLMTHLRLLQANLQYLKEVELKYKELQRIQPSPADDSIHNNDGVQ
uniref:Rho guanine nucleotide exchange factor (GEF) 12b n=2 Tax=Iconisemion striatum TaxID=60296 RepID=A0A1A7WW15_9TELE